jgi:hypothetical protein
MLVILETCEGGIAFGLLQQRNTEHPPLQKSTPTYFSKMSRGYVSLPEFNTPCTTCVKSVTTRPLRPIALTACISYKGLEGR